MEITSSVDFCEPNYEISSFIAEPANTLSSLFLVFQGLVGVLFLNKLRGESPKTSKWSNRFFGAMYLLLGVVGVGSVALHTCLCALGQALDELPMLFLSLSIITCLMERDCIGDKLSRPWLPYVVIGAACIETVIYTTFQELYFVFVTMHLTAVSVLIYWLGSIALSPRTNVQHEKIRVDVIKPIYVAALISYLGCGSFAWVTDFLLCTPISSLGWFAPMVLHSVWHLGAGMGSWLAIQVIAASRAEALSVEPKVVWWAGMLPYVMYVKYC